MRSLLTACFVASLLAMGCAPSNPGLVIEGVIAPPSGGTCLFDPSSPVNLSSGILDTVDHTADLAGVVTSYFGVRYVARLRAANHLINMFNGRYPLRADPNTMTIMSADVEIQTIDGAAFDFGGLPNPYRVPASGSVPSASSDSPGLGVATVELIPSTYGATLAAMGIDDLRLNVIIRLTGRTAGDATVTSGEYFFPIDLCAGCLFGCTTEADSAIACDIGQDAPTGLGAGIGACP